LTVCLEGIVDLATTPEPQHYDQPAAHLEGRTLNDGWVVGQRCEPSPGSTGGFFSVGYLAERVASDRTGDIERAFVKALDLTGWRQMNPDLPTAMHQMTDAFLFERRVIEECSGRRMSNVVRGVSHGEVQVGLGAFATVNYLVLELADGDIRTSLDAVASLDTAWALQVLHHVANGLRQLHAASISHQDLKPSNVLSFPDATKIGDLGRSFWAGQPSPHADTPIPGDITYAAPECLYGHRGSDVLVRSRAIDAYHLGSMARFMFTKVSSTGSLWFHLDPAFYPGAWRGTFAEVLPHLREAFNLAVDDLASKLPDHVRDDLLVLVRQLSDPDPAVRGLPRATPNTLARFSMEYYVSRLDWLAKRAGIRASRALL
jgi:serine/threonine protein kinase